MKEESNEFSLQASSKLKLTISVQTVIRHMSQSSHCRSTIGNTTQINLRYYQKTFKIQNDWFFICEQFFISGLVFLLLMFNITFLFSFITIHTLYNTNSIYLIKYTHEIRETIFILDIYFNIEVKTYFDP